MGGRCQAPYPPPCPPCCQTHPGAHAPPPHRRMRGTTTGWTTAAASSRRSARRAKRAGTCTTPSSWSASASSARVRCRGQAQHVFWQRNGQAGAGRLHQGRVPPRLMLSLLASPLPAPVQWTAWKRTTMEMCCCCATCWACCDRTWRPALRWALQRCLQGQAAQGATCASLLMPPRSQWCAGVPGQYNMRPPATAPRLQVFHAYADVQDEAQQRRRFAVLRNALLWRLWVDEVRRGRRQRMQWRREWRRRCVEWHGCPPKLSGSNMRPHAVPLRCRRRRRTRRGRS